MNDTYLYLCREIMHGGDGPPGPERKQRIGGRVLSRPHPSLDSELAAVFFVENLIDGEMMRERMDEEDLGNYHLARYVVEVRLPSETTWTRYCVQARVKLDFTATQVPVPSVPAPAASDTAAKAAPSPDR